MSNISRRGFLATAGAAAAAGAALAGCSSGAQVASQAASQASQGESDSTLYFTHQEVRDSPEWVTKLDVTEDAEQFILVAGVGLTTAVVTMHEKDSSGAWKQLISAPGFIGLEGLGPADSFHSYTPVGTFTIDRAFGLAPDPGCAMDYLQVDENYWWSGDEREGMHFNELVNIQDLPDLDKEESEQIAAFDYAYQYVLNMGFNAECKHSGGSCFFFHSFRVNRCYTGGCVAVPEDIMRFVMQHVKPGCKIKIDSLEKMGGDLDA